MRAFRQKYKAWTRCGRCLSAFVIIVIAGILSRTAHTGFIVVDKYLGDALYAAMIYTMLRPFQKSRGAAVNALAITAALELFQLTMIPAHLLQSDHAGVRMAARLLGTEFSFRDLAAYAVGTGAIYLMDRESP